MGSKKVDHIISHFKISAAKCIILYGATASGKTLLAVELAKTFGRDNCVIINADSMQVYQGIPIITTQPSADMMQRFNHRVYGVISCADSFSVAKWLILAMHEIEMALSSGIIPILVGGTGMYIDALLNGFSEIPTVPINVQKTVYDMVNEHGMQYCYSELMKYDHETAERLSSNDTQRITRALGVFLHTNIPISVWQQTKRKYIDVAMLKVFLNPDRWMLYENINSRFIGMIENGGIEEVQSLVMKSMGNAKYPKAIGLYQIVDYLQNKISMEELITLGQRMTRNYAKRQETWFRNRMCNQHDIVLG